jgi:hypothetical protein
LDRRVLLLSRPAVTLKAANFAPTMVAIRCLLMPEKQSQRL